MQVFKGIGRLAGKYNNLLERKPRPTTIISTGIILGTGDILMQAFEQRKTIKKFKYEPKRTACMAAYGSIVFGTFSYYWYCKWLPQMVPVGAAAIPTLKQTCAKVALDETLQSWFAIGTFLPIMTLLEGGSMLEAQSKLKKDFWTIYKTDLMFWPFVQFLNFKFVPNHYQALVVSTISVFWGAFLSYVQHRD